MHHWICIAAIEMHHFICITVTVLPFRNAGASDPAAVPEAELGGRWGHDHKDRLKSPGDIDEEAEANAERNRGPFLNPTTPKIRITKSDS